MPKKSGFTVLELIVCLVIISVIATTAMVKFMEIQADARANKIHDIAANLRNGIDVIYAKSVLAGIEKECNYTIKTEVESYFVCHGYPIAYMDSLRRLMNIDSSELKVINKDNFPGKPEEERRAAITFHMYEHTYEPQGNYCQVLYQPEEEPQVVVLDSAC
jgi:prepilin-type N-terminal cleavage/methylation domain-containing protein